MEESKPFSLYRFQLVYWGCLEFGSTGEAEDAAQVQLVSTEGAATRMDIIQVQI
jgi:hypothetical protein